MKDVSMPDRPALLTEIDRDRDEILGFYRDFIRAKSPNPPGDTREAAGHICKLLARKTLPYTIIAPMDSMPNVVGSFESPSPGRHLVLNGHIDVFPVGEGSSWRHEPWGGMLEEGRVFGRGACDMKAGTTASIFTYHYLYRHRAELRGKLTLTAVSDEETFGPWGARYLMEHHPEVHGDCLLNGEPSGLYNVRFGEKGALWLALTVRTAGAHGAHTHHSPSATKIASRLVGDLEAVAQIPVDVPGNVAKALELAAPGMEKSMGAGGSKIVSAVTLNIGVMRGGLKVNMVPGECRIEADIRLPVGLDKAAVMGKVEEILAGYPQVAMEELNYNAPSWCNPDGEMMRIIRRNVRSLSGIDPLPTVSLGATDARLWRYRNIPAYIYGPPPNGMGSHDEHVRVEDFFHVLRTHVLSAYDYLSRA
jgi:succinyl-diaminopimelate desuccinylase